MRGDLDGYLSARSFMGSLVSFVLLQKCWAWTASTPLTAEEYLAGQVDVYVRGAPP